MKSRMDLNSMLAASAAAKPADVLSVKQALSDLGFYETPEWGVSEYPDRAMFDAIRNFQESSGLRVDGVMKPGGESETVLKAMAETVRRQGRYGDTILAHITPAEANLLDRVTDGGSINPVTGVLEFWGGQDGDGDDFGWGPGDDNDDVGGDINTSNGGSSSGGYSDPGGDNDGDDFGWGAGADGDHDSWTGNSAGGNSPGSVGFQGDGGDTLTRQQYEYKLSTLSGWDKFVYGTQHGWKNWNSSRYNQPGVYDRELGRTLTAKDFAPGGARSMDTAAGRAAARRAVQQRAYAAELKQSAAKRAQAQNKDTETGLYALTENPVIALAPKTPGKVIAQLGIAPTAAATAKSSSKPKMASLAKADPTIDEQMQTLRDLGELQDQQAKTAAKRALDFASRPSWSEQMSAQAKEIGKNLAQNQKVQAATKAQATAQSQHANEFDGVMEHMAAMGTLPTTPAQNDFMAFYDDYVKSWDAPKTQTQTSTSNHSGVSKDWHAPMVLDYEPQTINLLEPSNIVPDTIKDEMKAVQHELNFEASKKSSPAHYYNDGFIGNRNDLGWKQKPDGRLSLKGGFNFHSTSFLVDGPIRIEPVSITPGLERHYMRVDWYELDEEGKPKPEFRSEKAMEHPVVGGFNSGFGSYDFAPPYPELNPYGYMVTITSPPQDTTHRNAAGVEVDIYTQQDGKTAKKEKETYGGARLY